MTEAARGSRAERAGLGCAVVLTERQGAAWCSLRLVVRANVPALGFLTFTRRGRAPGPADPRYAHSRQHGQRHGHMDGAGVGRLLPGRADGRCLAGSGPGAAGNQQGQLVLQGRALEPCAGSSGQGRDGAGTVPSGAVPWGQAPRHGDRRRAGQALLAAPVLTACLQEDCGGEAAFPRPFQCLLGSCSAWTPLATAPAQAV